MIAEEEDITDRTDYAGIGKRLLACISSKMTAEEREKLKDDSVFIEAKLVSLPTSAIGNKLFDLKKMLLGKYETSHLKFSDIEVEANDYSTLWWKTFLARYLKMSEAERGFLGFAEWYPFKKVTTVAQLEMKLSVEGF